MRKESSIRGENKSLPFKCDLVRNSKVSHVRPTSTPLEWWAFRVERWTIDRIHLNDATVALCSRNQLPIPRTMEAKRKP